MMPKKNTKKPSVKVDDMRTKKSPKGGAIYMKYDGISGESQDAKHKDELSYVKFKFDPLLNKVSK